MKRVIVCLPFLMLLAGFAGQQAQAQIRFESDYLFFSRNNDPDDTFISGPGGFSADDFDFGFDSGYRFTLGGSYGEFDIEASFFSIPDWTSSQSGILGRPLVFDDPTDAGIPGGPPGNGLGFRSALGTAADIAGLEDDEIEFLEAGAFAQTKYKSRLDSFELNLGSNRTIRPVYFAVGWRHLELDEQMKSLVVGDFQALDAGTGLAPGASAVGNDELSDAALTAAGFVNIVGADGFMGYDPTVIPPVITTLGIGFDGRARNDLDGVQVTLGGRYDASEMVTIDGFIKGGIYRNDQYGAVQETLTGVVNDGSIYSRTFTDRDATAAFGGAIGFDVIIAVTDYISFKTGYEALLLTNVAFGADQAGGVKTDLLGTTRYHVVNNGLFVAHGGHVGLEIGW